MLVLHARLAPALAAVLVGLICALRPPPAGAQRQDAAPPPAAAGPHTRIAVRVDPRVELMSTLFRLAGNPEYGQGRVDRYTRDVEARFGKLRDHAAVRTAAELRRRHGVSYDAVMSMAVHVTDPPALAEAVPFEPRPASLESRWTVADARRFLEAARAFSREAEFAAFFAAHGALFATAVERMQSVLAEHARLEWFDGFFGACPAAHFTLVLGMLNGGSCYGARRGGAGPGEEEELFCILGVWETDAEGTPRFAKSMLATVVHEFSHSYCNPLVDAHAEALRGPGEALWPHVADTMKAQAYGNWKTMMYESLVRASVVCYEAFAGGEAARRAQIDREHARGFTWVGALADRLAAYEQSREKYPSLGDFMPEVVAFFEETARAHAARMAQAPKVVSLAPANGADDVDPAVAEIQIVFDRPMRDRSWAVVRTGPDFPQISGAIRYDASRTVLTIPVALEPERRYEFWLNRGRYMSFQSAEGVPLVPLRVTFRTAARRSGT